MTERLLRVAVVGATGAVGSEVVSLLESRRFPLQELLPVATERSLGQDVELLGHSISVETEKVSLRGFDLALLCTPPGAALEWVRAALHAEVPCIDLSCALLESEDVPLLATELEPSATALAQPVLAAPSGSALAWCLALAPLARAFGLARVTGTALEPASGAGRGGIEALQSETLALFSHRDLPEPEVFERAVAFDCLPSVGEPDDDGATPAERHVAAALRRLVAPDLRAGVTAVRVPTFAGCGGSLALETERPATPAEVAECLGKAPGLALSEAPEGPSTREAAAGEHVLVGRLRRDPGAERGLLLWLAADPVRLAATNAVRLAEARFGVG